MAPSMQSYRTDALQEHPDSTSILIERLNGWRQAVHYFSDYANHRIQIQQSISRGLEKTRKGLSEPPQLGGGRTVQGTAVKSHGSAPTFADGFQNIQSQIDALLNESENTVGALKNSVLPPLELVTSDIDKHYKVLKSQGNKGIKEIEKVRESTQKLVERLGKFTSSYGTTKIESKDDPYILHRRIRAAISDQVARENTQAEAALSVQNSFASLERHVIHVIQQALQHIQGILAKYSNTELASNKSIAQTFGGVDMEHEWQSFAARNKERLVPSENYMRDPAKVDFANDHHPSVKPLIEGMLRRKGTVLKSYNTAFYVVTPTGYLDQFKTADPVQDPQPELCLYLPDSQLSALPPRSSSEYTFKILGKDTSKALSRAHKYTFKAASYDELVAWHNALSKVVGNSGRFDDDGVDSPSTPTENERGFAGESAAHTGRSHEPAPSHSKEAAANTQGLSSPRSPDAGLAVGAATGAAAVGGSRGSHSVEPVAAVGTAGTPGVSGANRDYRAAADESVDPKTAIGAGGTSREFGGVVDKPTGATNERTFSGFSGTSTDSIVGGVVGHAPSSRPTGGFPATTSSGQYVGTDTARDHDDHNLGGTSTGLYTGRYGAGTGPGDSVGDTARSSVYSNSEKLDEPTSKSAYTDGNTGTATYGTTGLDEPTSKSAYTHDNTGAGTYGTSRTGTSAGDYGTGAATGAGGSRAADFDTRAATGPGGSHVADFDIGAVTAGAAGGSVLQSDRHDAGSGFPGSAGGSSSDVYSTPYPESTKLGGTADEPGYSRQGNTDTIRAVPGTSGSTATGASPQHLYAPSGAYSPRDIREGRLTPDEDTAKVRDISSGGVPGSSIPSQFAPKSAGFAGGVGAGGTGILAAQDRGRESGLPTNSVLREQHGSAQSTTSHPLEDDGVLSPGNTEHTNHATHHDSQSSGTFAEEFKHLANEAGDKLGISMNSYANEFKDY